MNLQNNLKPPKPPYSDFTDPSVQTERFAGIVWFPTAVLRFVERQFEENTEQPTFRRMVSRRILQQQWETRTVRNANTLQHIKNPNYTQWRDVPLEEE